jgi:hypothetical protein
MAVKGSESHVGASNPLLATVYRATPIRRFAQVRRGAMGVMARLALVRPPFESFEHWRMSQVGNDGPVPS